MTTARKTGWQPARRPYEWPSVTIVHPEHGAYRIDVHGVRARGTGVITLVTFSGVRSDKQVPVIENLAAGAGNEIVQLSEDDITEDLGIFLAAQVHANPDTNVIIATGAEWGIGTSHG